MTEITSVEQSRWLQKGLIAAWAISAPVLALLYMKMPNSPDQMQFDYMAWISIQGMPFYAGSFDMNWPGAMMLHELALRLFGPHAWAWHLTDFLIIQALNICISLFLWRAGYRTAAFVFLAIFPAAYVTAGHWIVGQRDIIAGVFTLAACAFLVPHPRANWRSLVGAGLLLGCAVLIRPTYLLFTPFVMALEVTGLRLKGSQMPVRLKNIAALSLGGLLVLGGAILAGAAVGALDDWYAQSFLFATSVYVGDPPQDVLGNIPASFQIYWQWLSICAAIGVVCCFLRPPSLYVTALMVAFIVTVLVSYLVQNKGFIYHLGGWVPAMVILVAVGVEILWSLSRTAHTAVEKWGAMIGLCIVILLSCAGLGKKLFNERAAFDALLADGFDRQYEIREPDVETAKSLVIETILSESTAEDYVVQYGTAYDIPFLTGRKPSHRFITPAIDAMTPDFVLFEEWMQEVEDGFTLRPPKFVLIERAAHDLPAEQVQTMPVLAATLAQVQNNYDVISDTIIGVLYQRRVSQ